MDTRSVDGVAVAFFFDTDVGLANKSIGQYWSIGSTHMQAAHTHASAYLAVPSCGGPIGGVTGPVGIRMVARRVIALEVLINCLLAVIPSQCSGLYSVKG